jgi:hypothetical protein
MKNPKEVDYNHALVWNLRLPVRHMAFTMHMLATLDLVFERLLKVNQGMVCYLLGLFARKMDYPSVKETNKEN